MIKWEVEFKECLSQEFQLSFYIKVLMSINYFNKIFYSWKLRLFYWEKHMNWLFWDSI
jgi:hypothetical protein